MQSTASPSRFGSSLRGRRCASTSIEMRPARSSTFRCLEMAGWLISNGSASSVTVASPVASRARMARRVGSAKAAKVRSRGTEVCITVELYNVVVIYRGKTGQSSCFSFSHVDSLLDGRVHFAGVILELDVHILQSQLRES